MATLAPKGRIDELTVNDEITRLKSLWSDASEDLKIIAWVDQYFDQTRLTQIDLFDQLQLNSVIAVCRKSSSLSDAGRTLFAASRAEKVSPNDADRLRKYLSRFDLSWERISV